ncbi:MAG TPA: ABC transporter substrate-binding protein [Thermomicrobiales bacterium]|jgi:peptide/nickel transport system substrate-binding protein
MEQKSRNPFARSGLAVLFSLVLLSMSLAPITRVLAQDQPVQGGTLQMSLGEEPDQLDPARTIELTASYVNSFIYDQLTYIGADGLPHPWVAESWQISPDNLTITMKIRQGIKFHDGTALDAPAVKAGYDRILDPAMAAPYKAFLGPIKDVEAPDATTLVFNYEKPYAPFFNNASVVPIVSPAAVEKEGDDFGHKPVGSGPFVLKEWESATKIVLDRNPDYVNYREDDTNKGPAYVDEVVLNIISEPATRTAAFESGELDILDVPSADVERLQAEPGVTIVAQEKGHNINFIEFSNKPPFNNEHFRKAIAYATDSDSVTQIAYLGRATTNNCPVPVGDASYDTELCTQHGYSYDLDKAKAELAAGGFTDSDGNGVVEMDGKDIAVTLWSYSGFDVQQKTLELLQPDLNKIGLKVDIQTIDFGALQPKLEAGETGFDYMRWTFYDQSILSQLFKTPGWVKQTSDPDLDKLLDTADTTVDPKARLDATHAAMTYVLDHCLIVPINTDWFQSAVHDHVHNYHWDATDNERIIDVWLSK